MQTFKPRRFRPTIHESLTQLARASTDNGHPPSTNPLVRLAQDIEQPARVFDYGTDVEDAEIPYVWQGYLPEGLVLIYGDMGIGKGLMTLDWASRMARGAPWPTGTPQRVRPVVVLSEEDDATVIRQRLKAAGAPLHAGRIKGVSGLRSIDDDLRTLRDICQTYRPGLVIVDPVNNHLPHGINTHNDAETAPPLQTLNKLGQEYHLTVLAIGHMGKAQRALLYRSLGSIAYMRVPRAAFAVMDDPDDAEQDPNQRRRLVVNVKQSSGKLQRTMAFRIRDGKGAKRAARVAWDQEGSDRTKHTLDPREPHRASKTDAVVTFLTEQFGTQSEIRSDGLDEHDFSAKDLERARTRMGVDSLPVRDRKGRITHYRWVVRDRVA